MRQTCKEEEEGGHPRQRELQRRGRAWNVPETERRLERLDVGEQVGKRWEEGIRGSILQASG